MTSLSYQSISLRNFSGLTDRVIDSSPNMFEEIDNFRLDKNGNMVLREGCVKYAYGNAGLPKLLLRNKAGYLYGVAGNHTFFQNGTGVTEGDYEIQSGPAFIESARPDDLVASANHWRGIEYLTFGRDKSNAAIAADTTRFSLTSLYMYEVPSILDANSYIPKTINTGCPYLDVIPTVSQAAVPPSTTATVYYIAYKQTVVANVGTTAQVTQASFGEGRYTELLQLNRNRDDNPAIINIINIKNPDRDDYDNSTFLTTAVVYRTHPLDLNTFYLVAEKPFLNSIDPVDVFDDVYDDELLDNERLYISEGIVEMEQPPKHSTSAIINGTAFYGNIELYDETDGKTRTYKEYNYKIIQSMQGNPTMVNRTFFADFEDEIIGLGGLHNALIVFTKSKIVRIDGFKNNDGSGGFNQRTISDDAGCVSHKSIISDGDNLYFFGLSGVYKTNGYEVVKISSTPEYDITETYQSYVKDFVGVGGRPLDHLRDQATGYYDARRDVLYWAVAEDGAPVVNKLLVYDKFNSCFYKIGGNAQDYPAILIEDDYFLRANERATILKHHDQAFSDIVAVNENEEEWFESFIPYGAKTVGIDFGSPSIKKWVNFIMATLSSKSKMGIGLRSFNDISNAFKNMKAITIDSIMLWRDENLRWKDPITRWRSKNTDTHKRRFPKRALRCRYKQLEIYPTETKLYTSATFGSVNMVNEVINAGSKLKVSFDKFDYYHTVRIDITDPLIPQYFITKPEGFPQWITLCYEETGSRCSLHQYAVDPFIFKRITEDPDVPVAPLSMFNFATADPTHTIQVVWDTTPEQTNRFNVTIRDALNVIVFPDFTITSNFTSKVWPDDILSYQIKFEEEEYEIGYLIIDFFNDISVPYLLAEGGGGVAVGTGKLFEMFGIRKQQSFTIENLTISYAPLSEKGAEYLNQGVADG